MNLEQPLLQNNHEIDEECASGDSGSTKNAKKVHQNFLEVPGGARSSGIASSLG